MQQSRRGDGSYLCLRAPLVFVEAEFKRSENLQPVDGEPNDRKPGHLRDRNER